VARVEFPDFNLTGDHITGDRMPLTELLQKASETDFLRAVAESVLQILMEADVEGAIGGPGQRRPTSACSSAIASII
jgi:hypothetical protein